ncbi:hypothetical protein B0H13DRAFT_1866250 [Mycena leptocephala]|nr:hypothetical protein B0H13DRAFT_1866250 [Mycena leptocephala]
MIFPVRGVEMLGAHGKPKIRGHAGKESHGEIIGDPDDARWWRMGSTRTMLSEGMEAGDRCVQGGTQQSTVRHAAMHRPNVTQIRRPNRIRWTRHGKRGETAETEKGESAILGEARESRRGNSDSETDALRRLGPGKEQDIALKMGRRKKQVVVGVIPNLSFDSHHKIVGSNAFAYPRLPIAEGFRGGIIWDMVQGLAGIHTA